MVTDIELSYIAGIIDGEGYIGIKKSKAYKCQGRKTPGYHARIQVRMVNEAAIRFVAESLGGWYYPEKKAAKNRRILFCFQASDQSAADILRKIIPFLRVKRASAETVLECRALQAEGGKHRTRITGYRNFPNSHGTPRRVANKAFSTEYVAMCEAFYRRCKALNKTGC